MSKYANGATRVLYIPHTSSPDSLVTDHAYGWATAFFSEWLRRDPNVKVYWPVPRKALWEQKAAFYKFEDEISKKNVMFFEVDMDEMQVLEQARLQPELLKMFSIDYGSFYFDYLFCEKPSILGLFFGGCRLSTQERRHKLVVANMHYAMDSTQTRNVSEELEATYFANAARADAFLFGCADACDIDSWSQFRTKLREQCSMKIASDCIAKPRWVKPCSDVFELKNKYDKWVAEGSQKGEGFRIHYGFSVNSNFGYGEILEVIQSMRSADSDLRFVITTSSKNFGASGFKPADWAEVHLKCPRPDFHDIALKSHCFVMWSAFLPGLNHGSVIEMARLGVLPLLLEKGVPYPWDKTYKFCFKTTDELRAMLKFVKANYDKPVIQDEIKRNIELIDRTYAESGHGAIIDKLVAMKRAQYETGRPPKSPFKDILTRLPSYVTMSDLVDFVKKNTTVHVNLRTLAGAKTYQYGTVDSLRTYLLSEGYVDVGDAKEPAFQRA